MTLLRRGPDGARLTPAGQQVVTLGRRVLSEARVLMAAVEALVAEQAARLRVAASLTVAEHLLPAGSRRCTANHRRSSWPSR